MDRIYTSGETLGVIRCENGNLIHYSILSRRAAALLIKKSMKKELERFVVKYDELIMIDGDYVLVGFQPISGRHIAVKLKKRGL